MKTITTPKTIAQVKELPNYIEVKTVAEASAKAHKFLEEKGGYGGPVLSAKVFVEGKSIVYEYYQLLKRENNIYVIF